MTNFVIIHGTMGSPEGNWFPWMKEKLEANGHNVIVPAFPSPEGQDQTTWLATFNKATKDLEPDNTVLIGHSMGATLVLRISELAKAPYKAIYSICPFDCLLNCELDPLITSFVEDSYNWTSIKRGAKQLHLFAGDNDPYVPLKIPQRIADNMSLSLNIIKDGGHLNAEFDYTSFPSLYDHIRNAALI